MISMGKWNDGQGSSNGAPTPISGLVFFPQLDLAASPIVTIHLHDLAYKLDPGRNFLYGGGF